MTDQVLDILKLALLALIYLFFARVLWAVWSEVRVTATARNASDATVRGRTSGGAQPAAGEIDQTAGLQRPKPGRGRGDTPARLAVLEPKALRGAAYAIGDTVSIGRERDNTVVVADDDYISSRHAAVSVDGERVVVDDLGSRNGTFVNGKRLTQRHPLHRGDRIQVGYLVLEAQ